VGGNSVGVSTRAGSFRNCAVGTDTSIAGVSAGEIPVQATAANAKGNMENKSAFFAIHPV
jgi:hypothetical protein